MQSKYNTNPVNATTTLAPAGIDNADAPQFLNVNYALNIQNYEPKGIAKLSKRKGLVKIFEVAGNKPISLLKQWTSDVWIFGYDTTIARYTLSTDTVANIKTDFSANTGFDGVRYGDYFFVCNGVDKIWRIDFATFTPTQVAASPATTSVLAAIGPRLYAGYGDIVRYSEVDDGTNPPFNTWSNGTLATDGGVVSYRNVGDAQSIVPLGDSAVVFSDKGFFAFSITTLDSAGTLSKTENIGNYVEDFGGARGAISTEKGIYYANEAGLWNLTSIGQSNVPFSRQYAIVSTLLGDTYFDNIDTSNCDIFYDRKKQAVYLSCAKGSATNNLVIACKVDKKNPVFYKITNWNISRFMDVDGTIYGASDAKTVVYRLFDGYTDDGQIIGTDYYQELKLGDLETRQMLMGCYTQGFLSPSSLIKVKFDIYDVTGKPITDKLKYEWTAQYALSGHDGYNSAHYNSSAYGGDEDYSTLVESFDGCRPFIRNFQRLRVHITSNDTTAHILTWVKLDSRVKAKIRRRKLTLTT